MLKCLTIKYNRGIDSAHYLIDKQFLHVPRALDWSCFQMCFPIPLAPGHAKDGGSGGWAGSAGVSHKG